MPSRFVIAVVLSSILPVRVTYAQQVPCPPVSTEQVVHDAVISGAAFNDGYDDGMCLQTPSRSTTIDVDHARSPGRFDIRIRTTKRRCWGYADCAHPCRAECPLSRQKLSHVSLRSRGKTPQSASNVLCFHPVGNGSSAFGKNRSGGFSSA